MSCDCKEDLEAKLLENFKTKHPKATDHEAMLHGYGYVMNGNTMTIRGFFPVKQSAKFPLKSGAMKPKTISSNMFFSYCPFCGVKS